MDKRTKLHDGIVGIIYLVSIILALNVSIQWIYVAVVVAVLQILSMFTGFCPVYFVLDKTMKSAKA